MKQRRSLGLLFSVTLLATPVVNECDPGPGAFFEGAQAASGMAQLVGDVEYRGQGLNRSSGTHFGYVDANTAPASNTADVTIAGPYTCRP